MSTTTVPRGASNPKDCAGTALYSGTGRYPRSASESPAVTPLPPGRSTMTTVDPSAAGTTDTFAGGAAGGAIEASAETGAAAAAGPGVLSRKANKTGFAH